MTANDFISIKNLPKHGSIKFSDAKLDFKNLSELISLNLKSHRLEIIIMPLNEKYDVYATWTYIFSLSDKPKKSRQIIKIWPCILSPRDPELKFNDYFNIHKNSQFRGQYHSSTFNL